MATTSPLLPPTTPTTSIDQSQAYAALTTGDFTKIIINELQQQDPLKPNDTNTLVQELSTLRNIQSSSDLSTSLSDMVSQNQFSTAAALIGKNVSGLDDSDNRTNGIVKSVSKTTAGPVLNLDNGSRVPFSTIDTLQELGTTTDPTSTTP